MRAGIKSILLILACAVLFGAGFRPRPLPAAAYAATGYSFAGALRAGKNLWVRLCRRPFCWTSPLFTSGPKCPTAAKPPR